jgi:hypothetical protein
MSDDTDKVYKNYFEYEDGTFWRINASNGSIFTETGFVNTTVSHCRTINCPPETIYADSEKKAKTKSKKALPQTAAFWKTAILLSFKSDVFKFIPEEQLTEEICLTAMMRNGRDLEFVPPALRTYPVCLESVRNGGWLELAFLILDDEADWERSRHKYVPETLRTAELCMEAIRHSGGAAANEMIRYIPPSVLTYEMCLEILKRFNYVPYISFNSHLEQINDSPLFNRIPEQFRTRELYLTAVQTSGQALLEVPAEFVTKDFIVDAVTEDQCTVLLYVPDHLKTRDLYFEAVRKYRFAIKYTPKEFMTEEVCLSAVRGDGRAIEYVPRDLQNDAMFLAAIQGSGARWARLSASMRWHWVESYTYTTDSTPYPWDVVPWKFWEAIFDPANPEHELYKTLFVDAVKNGLRSLRITDLILESLPKNEFSQDLCIYAMICMAELSFPAKHFLKRVPEEYKTREFYLGIVENTPTYQLIMYTPDEYKTYEFCLTAVKKHPDNYRYVPDEFKTPELTFAAAELLLPDCKLIPAVQQTRELWQHAVQYNGKSLGKIPESERTAEICVTALNTWYTRLNEEYGTGYNAFHDISLMIPAPVRQEVCALFLSGDAVHK